MVAPVAASVAEEPAQMVVKEGVSVRTGMAMTLMVDVAELVQVPLAPVTV